jgi:hypothetical protein
VDDDNGVERRAASPAGHHGGHKSEDAGIDEHLVKPVYPDVLQRLLAAGLWADRDAVDQVEAPAARATGEGR